MQVPQATSALDWPTLHSVAHATSEASVSALSLTGDPSIVVVVAVATSFIPGSRDVWN